MPLHSKAGFQSARGNLCAPPLPFGRRPPQPNYPPDNVPDPDNGPGLEFQKNQGGISRTTPSQLASGLHSLPPILHKLPRNSLSSCSKGARGLSVLPRVNGIFTATAISPSPWLRQRGSRYAIRAGRNLPDKEFRYLRTVIVTAAVYWGFSSLLLPRQAQDDKSP
jgi:hypothetical protein